MEKYFVTIQTATALKELGFNAPCLAYFQNGKLKQVREGTVSNDSFIIKAISAPLHQQVIDWFIEEYKIYLYVQRKGEKYWWVMDDDSGLVDTEDVVGSMKDDYHFALNKAIYEGLKTIGIHRKKKS